MKIDHDLVTSGLPHPHLRIYDWARPAITAGLFSDPERLLDLDRCCTLGMDVVKRPTGGGVLFHNKDLVCAIFVPGETAMGPLCDEISARLLRALAPFLPPKSSSSIASDTRAVRFCMAQRAPTDLFWNGTKIGGCAQRTSRFGVLHQTSIFLHTPNWEEIAPFVRCADDLRAMQITSTSLEEICPRPINRQSVREAIAKQFKEGFP